MATQKEALQLMFTRPCEPIFMPKGQGTPVVFNVPDAYLTERHRKLKDRINQRFDSKSAKSFQVKNITLPDISLPQQLPIKENFSLFLPSHEEMAAKLIEIFMNQKSVDDLISVAAYCHERINPYLFNYALSVAMLHRKDTKEVSLPNFLECFPGKFVDSTVISEARQESVLIPRESREVVVLAREYTANSREPEQRLAFFREDIGVNLHHWYWHLVYPTRAATVAMVNKDRRGELFYYMHQQIMARYNIERFAQGMNRVKTLDSFKEVIPEGYFPKLARTVASRAWAPRFVNYKLADVVRPNDRVNVKISDMETWEKNIMDAIKNRMAIDEKGNHIPLNEKNGIDILGNMVEACVITPNRALYGNLHNMGHVVLAFCHDPDGRFLESFGTVGDNATSMRDPVFYRWHSKLNEIFMAFKDCLPKYTIAQLDYKNISITDVQVVTEGKNTSPNEFQTFWQQTDVDLSRGIDFVPRGPVRVRFTHLQHENFVYNIKVKNASSSQVMGTVRIFMAPKVDDKGTMTFDVQRKLMIELDKFKTTLKPGDNTVTRKSLDSSLTIPFERTFRNIDTNLPTEATQLAKFTFCGCGWPQHMLLPKGNDKSMKFDLFVMVSNIIDDKIDQDITGVCSDADSFCGIQDKLYPDKRSMGYPFDRMGRDGVRKLSDFLTPNMKVRDVAVKFTERTVVKNFTSSPSTSTTTNNNNNTNNSNTNNNNNNNNNSNTNNNNNNNNNSNTNNNNNNRNNNNNNRNNNNNDNIDKSNRNNNLNNDNNNDNQPSVVTPNDNDGHSKKDNKKRGKSPKKHKKGKHSSGDDDDSSDDFSVVSSKAF